MKNIVLITALLAAGLNAPAFAAELQVTGMPIEIIASLEESLAHSRVSVGASRDSVLTEMRDPNILLHPDIWVYTGFRATNVFGAERYDALVLTFKNDKVATIRLANEEQVRVAAGRTAGALKTAKQ